MQNPCNTCLVQACCTERCTNYAIYIYKSKEYEIVCPSSSKIINDMEYHAAINHILMVENCYLSIKE